MSTFYKCNELADKIYSELGWICNNATDLEIILALSMLIGRYGDHNNQHNIREQLFEQIKNEEYVRAKKYFDDRLKKVMNID